MDKREGGGRVRFRSTFDQIKKGTIVIRMPVTKIHCNMYYKVPPDVDYAVKTTPHI